MSTVAPEHVLRLDMHHLGRRLRLRPSPTTARPPPQLGPHAGAVLIEQGALIPAEQRRAALGRAPRGVRAENGRQLGLRQVLHLGGRRGLQLRPRAASHVVLRGYLLTQQRGAVAEVPPLAHRRRLGPHLRLDTQLPEQLHRARVDQVRARVGGGLRRALHQQRRHAVAREQRRCVQANRAASDDEHRDSAPSGGRHPTRASGTPFGVTATASERVRAGQGEYLVNIGLGQGTNQKRSPVRGVRTAIWIEVTKR